MGNILDQIVETKRAEVAAARRRRPLAELKSALADLPPPRDFHAALAGPPLRGVHLVAEIKRKSPSAGLIRPELDPAAIAKIYADHGASAISVLTDATYFDGRLEYIAPVKSAVPLPVLRKDFTIDEYQVYEARAAGADAVLLIGEVLPVAQLRDLLDLAFGLGMTSLIEVHDAESFESLQTTVGFPNERRSLLGINNRNLKIQRTDLGTTERLARLVPPGTVFVSESGIKTRSDVERLIAAGARGLLIGETLLRAPDIGAKVDELLSATRSV